MEYRSLDPYEQQLLKVFDSYDCDNLGSLDKDGLIQLCHSLQLEEQSGELIKSLLRDPKSSRATFAEFKEALLTLLGTMQNGKTSEEVDKISPDREVSPKYVYGSKKYGRKSRPKTDEIVARNDMMKCSEINVHCNSIQKSNSQSDVSYSKKRKTNYSLKRCTSFPGRYNLESEKTGDLNSGTFKSKFTERDLICTEDMLREAWKSLGVGQDGYLNKKELTLVCDAIGLHEIAKHIINQLSNNKASLNGDDRVSFQEVLEILQQDETWSEVLNASLSEVVNEPVDFNTTITNDSIFPNSRTVQYIMFGPDGVGTVNTNFIIELWENAGITSPKLLLHDLGFISDQINVIDLASVLEKEVKGISETNRSDFLNPHVALLHATLTLYQSEILCLKTILEQMHAEREKLKCDVVEANNRATLLAQEVDDNHAKMEQNTQNQVRLIEQRHADILKEITNQLSTEKEHLSVVNQKLEQKIQFLENEEAKLKNDLIMAQNYSSSLERENQMLSTQVSELQHVKNNLSQQIDMLENEKQKYSEIEVEQIEPLLAKLAALQVENSQLRDKNDEMMSEIENLTSEVSIARTKTSSTPTYNTLDQSIEENISIICEGVGIGAKRRNDESPSTEIACGLSSESPRLGKIRKFQKSPDYLDVPFISNESGVDADLDGASENEEISRLKARIANLEEILIKHSISLPTDSNLELSTNKDFQVVYLTNRCKELEDTLSDVKLTMDRLLESNCDVSAGSVKSLIEKLENVGRGNGNSFVMPQKMDESAAKDSTDVGIQTENDDTRLELKLEECEKTNNTLRTKCEELENCVELLRTEYERCEDYWSAKLDEERQIFEQEQIQNSEKLTELINKMTEYEEQFAVQDACSRLPPIEEKYNLEKQFTDLEQEYEKYREASEQKLEEKNSEIAALKEKVTDFSAGENKNDIGIQVELLHNFEMKADKLTNHLVESTNLFSADTMPFGWNITTSADLKQSNDNSSNMWYEDSDLHRNDSSGSVKSLQSNVSSLNYSGQSVPAMNLPSTSDLDTPSLNSQNNFAVPCRPKRVRKHLGQKLYKKNNLNHEEKGKSEVENSTSLNCNSKSVPEQTCVVPVSTIHNLNLKLAHLEQRCRHLHVVIKQQHHSAEQILKCYWQQHRGEKTELQYMLKINQEKLEHQIRVCNEQLERLAKADILVKDLYVENSYLIANVQRLEQQCHILAQCNSNTSSF